MSTVIVAHEVKDTQHWLASSMREEAFASLGASNIRTFVNPQNPQQVAVMTDVADLDALLAALQSQNPDVVNAMQHDGVLPETLSILVES
jgi:uncharacterized protein YidB (DUF937 family)